MDHNNTSPVATGTLPDDVLGAFCRDNHVALAHSANGVLDGRSFATKDVFDIAGHRTGFGNPDWRTTHPPATATARAVELLLRAGADMAGKTITDELTYSLAGEHHHYGTPCNPAAPDRVPGGSSSGSAVAGGVVDFALGTDCGGSVRIPASHCGIPGFRPTHGRVSVESVVPFAPSFDVVGWFARDARVSERVGAVLFEQKPVPASGGRLLLIRDAFDLVAPNVTRALEPAIARVAALCDETGEQGVSPAGLQEWYEVFRVVQGAEISANHKDWLAAVKPVIGPAVRARLEWASTLDAAAIAAAKQAHVDIRHHLERLLAAGDFLCLPTSPRVAPLKREPSSTLENEYRMQALCLLSIAGLGGLPQLSLPLAMLDGLPLGLSIIGPRGSNMQLLALAVRLASSPD